MYGIMIGLIVYLIWQQQLDYSQKLEMFKMSKDLIG